MGWPLAATALFCVAGISGQSLVYGLNTWLPQLMRAFGVGSGMPLRIATRNVPDVVILPVDRDAYLTASDAVMAVLREQPDAVVQVLGWDEALLGVETEDPEA